VIYSLFDRSHVALVPWQRAGYQCTAVDNRAACDPGDGIRHVVSDILNVNRLTDAAFVLAFPPCTHLCSSGSRWWQEKGLEPLQYALSLVEKTRSLIGATPGVMENPVGRLPKHFRQYDVKVHPWEFDALTVDDDSYSKATCLWLFNGASAPRRHHSGMFVDTRRIHHMGSSRSDERSKTPQGMANAIFLANYRKAEK